jgi:hypothetical protein
MAEIGSSVRVAIILPSEGVNVQPSETAEMVASEEKVTTCVQSGGKSSVRCLKVIEKTRFYDLK